MKKVLIKFIRIYQNIPGSFHGVCRHIPSCSNYGIDAINEYGACKGSLLTIRRIFKCHPWGSWGFDPVIKKELKK